MADVKREVRALGQKITGLKAGDNVTLVLKKPKPKVDASAAKKATQIAGDQINAAHDAIATLTRARDMASSGDGATAKKLLQTAKAAFDKIKQQAPRAKEWAANAKDDHEGAPSEVKDGYGAAKDGADLAVGHLDHVTDGFEKAMQAVGAYVEEVLNR